MEKVTDWITLWKELIEKQGPFWNRGKRSEKNEDKWKDRAKGFDAKLMERWSKPDPHRDFIISTLSSFKDATVLDIGAGTGAWAIYMSKVARKVTALEPSAGMRRILQNTLKRKVLIMLRSLIEAGRLLVWNPMIFHSPPTLFTGARICRALSMP